MSYSLFYKIIIVSFYIFNCDSMSGQLLNDYQWKNRIVILYTPDESNELYQNQLSEFLDQDEKLKERKILVCRVIKDKYQMTNYLKPKQDVNWKPTDLDFNSKHNPQEEFEVNLIGLDGGVKLSQNKILKIEELYRIIDSMPMRSSEIRNKN